MGKVVAPEDMRDVRKSITMTTETAERLALYARAHRWTVSTAAVALIEDGLDDNEE